MTAILSTQNVTKRFGGLVAVNDFSVEVEKESISSIIGPNGAGKTTFFNCVTGFYKPEEGEIDFVGRPIARLRTQARNVDELAIRLRGGVREQLACKRNRLEPAAHRLAALHPARLADRARAWSTSRLRIARAATRR